MSKVQKTSWMAQELAIRHSFGQAPTGNYPPIILGDALRVLAYWWRQRGRHWHEWHKALDALAATGVKPSIESLTKTLNSKQREIVWGAAYDAALDMTKLAPTYTPQPFATRQSSSDAKLMMGRYFAKDFDSKIPPLGKKSPIPKPRDPGWRPPGPRRPGFSVSRPLMLLALLWVLTKTKDS